MYESLRAKGHGYVIYSTHKGLVNATYMIKVHFKSYIPLHVNVARLVKGHARDTPRIWYLWKQLQTDMP